MAALIPDLARAQRLVVKIGSALLVGPDGLRAAWLRALCDDVAAARARGSKPTTSDGAGMIASTASRRATRLVNSPSKIAWVRRELVKPSGFG